MAIAVAQEANPDFIAGTDQFNKGEYSTAIDSFTKVTTATPDYEPAWYYLGVSKFKSSPPDYSGALEALTKAAGLRPTRAGTKFIMAQIYEKQGAYDEAVRAYQEELSLRKGRDEAEVYNALGRTYLMMGQLDSAQDVLQRAIDQKPKYVEAIYDLGLVYLSEKDSKNALRQFKRANDILSDYDQAKARLNRLTEAEKREKKATEEQAAEEFGYAIEFIQDLGLRPSLNESTGDAYLLTKQWSDARMAYTHALRPAEGGNPADPGAHARIGHAFLMDAEETFYKNGLVLSTAHIAASAEHAYADALKNDADAPVALNGLGEVYAFEAATYGTDPTRGITSHTYDEAITKFNAALQGDPNLVAALLNLGRAYLSLGDRQDPHKPEAQDYYNKARDPLDKALALRPKDPAIIAELARDQLALEQYDDALRTAQTALQIDKNNLVALNAAGMVHYVRGELGDAATYFTEAILADNTKPQSYTNLGNTYFQMSSWFRARAEYRNALQRTPDALIARTAAQRSYLLFLVGVTHFETGAYQPAIDSFNQALALDPAYFDALRALAKAYQALKDYRAAERALQIALQQPPDDKSGADVQCQLGEMYEEEGRTHEAIAAFSASLATDPSNVRAQEGLQRIHGR
jgi:tetratricopeptide (TPR) repeat protein